MSLCTVAELRSVLGIGALYTDAQLQECCDAADAVLLPMLWTNSYEAIGHSRAGMVGTLYFDFPAYDAFYVGETVTVANCGSHFNGSKTITAVGDDNITFTVTGPSATYTFNPIQPYGKVSGDETTDWTADASVQLAAQFISVDIWQARNAAGMGSVGIDGSPMPYRLNTQLLSKVRGLIAHALAPGGLVG